MSLLLLFSLSVCPQTGTNTGFKSTFAVPISQSRDSKAEEKDMSLGEARSVELARITSKFVLRRTADILQKYLPPKIEQVVFCPLSDLQQALYRSILESKSVKCVVSNSKVNDSGDERYYKT